MGTIECSCGVSLKIYRSAQVDIQKMLWEYL